MRSHSNASKLTRWNRCSRVQKKLRTIYKCFFKKNLFNTDFWQCGQVFRLCDCRIWVFSRASPGKAFPQNRHKWGLSSLWKPLMCILKFVFPLNIFPQCLHLCFSLRRRSSFLPAWHLWMFLYGIWQISQTFGNFLIPCIRYSCFVKAERKIDLRIMFLNNYISRVQLTYCFLQNIFLHIGCIWILPSHFHQ